MVIREKCIGEALFWLGFGKIKFGDQSILQERTFEQICGWVCPEEISIPIWLDNVSEGVSGLYN